MKKILCILLTAIILLLTSCNTAKPLVLPEEVETPSESSSVPIEEYIPESSKTEDEVDATEAPKESTDSNSNESTSNGDNWVASLFSTDYYNEYLDFLSNDKIKVPDNFITYDMIKNIGAFEGLVVYSFDDYGYLLFDENDILISVRILSTLNNASTTTITSTYESNDLRKITAPNNQESTLFHNGILYNYSKSGGLYRISWQYVEQAITIVITMGYVHLNEYPLEGETTFVSQLLSTQTATAVVEAFNQKVEAEIAKNIADKQQKG